VRVTLDDVQYGPYAVRIATPDPWSALQG
jgi:hypothetical protein